MRAWITVALVAGLLPGAAFAMRGGLGLAPERVPAAGQRSDRPTFDQEFNGRAGTRLNPRIWTYDIGGEPQWGNQEWEYYTSRRQNVSMDGHGHLAIVARREQLPGMAHCLYGTCDITSARITTKARFAQAHGRFEARIKLPRGAGLWPAFWMLGNNIDKVDWPACGEIDAMEVVGSHPDTVYGTIHAPGYVDVGIGGQKTVAHGVLDRGFHVYEVDWGPQAISWRLDGRTYFVARKSQLRRGQAWPFDHPFYMLLNLAVGGTFPGPPSAGTQFPAPMLVDWIRVYR